MTLLYKWMDEVGDGTGNRHFVDNYKMNKSEAKFTPGDGRVAELTRVIITITDNKFKHLGYGGRAALTNGIEMKVKNGDKVLIDITDGIPITIANDWASLCFDAELRQRTFIARFTFERAGKPLRLNGGDTLAISLNDDFSTLLDHKFIIQGEIR